MLITNFITTINIFILFSLLFFRKDNPLPNKILAFIFLIPGLYFIDNALIVSGYITQAPWFFFFVQIIAILYPILVYIYVSLLIAEKIKLNKFLTAGSALLLGYILFITIHFYSLSGAEQLNYLTSLSGENYPGDILVYTILFYAWQLVYFSILTYKTNKYSTSINNALSSIDAIQITYIRRFMTLSWILNLGLVFMYLTLPMYYVDYFFLPVFVSIVYIFILYFCYHHNSIFTRSSLTLLNEVNKSIDENNTTLFEEKKPTITPTDKHQKIYELLKTAIEVDKEYKNPELTLKILADKLNSPSYLVSQTINLFYKKSFFDLINERRVQDAKERLMASPLPDKIETIAYDAGFNSRAAFYRAYKKYTGETPGENRKAA